MTSVIRFMSLVLLIIPGHIMVTTDIGTTLPIDCDFEQQGFCGWSSDIEADLAWTLRTAAVMTQSQTSGVSVHDPHSDHTLRNIMGHFVQVAKSYRSRNGKRARLVSPRVNIPETGICFQFWYYMYGPRVSTINVYVDSDADSGEYLNLVWTKSGTQGPYWRLANVHFQNFTGKAFITIELETDRRLQNPSLDDFKISYGLCPPSDTCDFEDGHLCSYTQSTADVLDWKLNSLGKPSSYPGPETDHTFGTNEGHYAYVDAPLSRTKEQNAVLETHLFPATSGSCLSFWYYMHGKGVDVLNILIKFSSNNAEMNASKILWTKSGNQGTEWLMTSLILESNNSYSILFEGIVESDADSDIAIDDVSVNPGLCPSWGSCDFESDTCPWRNDLKTDDFDWTRERGHNSDIVFSPQFDHTFNSYLGHYLYFDSNQGPNALVSKYISPPLVKDKIYCFNAWYIIGKTGVNLSIATQKLGSKEEAETVFNTSTVTENDWNRLRLVIGPLTSDFNLVIIGSIESRYEGIAIDDLDIQEGHCESLPSPEQTKNAYQCPQGNFLSVRELCNFHNDCSEGDDEKFCGYDCDFEDETSCKWEASQTGGYVWKTEKSSGLGSPNQIHRYLNFESTKESQKSGYALFLSPFFQKSSPNCEFVFSLLYHNVNHESFDVKKLVGHDEVTLFEARKDSTNKWRKIVIALGESKVPFRVILSAGRVKYGARKGSIAVDNIHFRNCDFPQPGVSCTSENTFPCNNSACVHPSFVCNFIDDCGDQSDETNQTCSSYHRCGFEDGHFCVWSQESDEDDLDFYLQRGMQYIGPFVDHTTNTALGHFLMLDTRGSKRLPGDKAWLLSPVLEPSSSCLLNFYLYMYGEGTESVSVYIRSVMYGNTTQVFTKSGETGNFWVFTSIQIKSLTKFQIIIEGITGKDNRGRIAIDDVILTPGCIISSEIPPQATSTPPPTESPCGHTAKWQCQNGSQCIFKEERCDFVAQCHDGSDEMDCGTCDFDTSACGWHDRTRGRYVWYRVDATSTEIKFKPEEDHTQRGEDEIGSYMLLHNTGRGYIRPAVLESPILGSTDAGCSVRFHYLMDNNNGYLRLYLYPKEMTSYERNHGLLLWTSTLSAAWKEELVKIDSRAAGFRLVFIYFNSVALETNQFGPAIDDVTFTPQCGATNHLSLCPHGQFMCQTSRQCKPSSLRCDLAKDCPTGEDEKGCDNYFITDFENGLNHFVIDTSGADIWTIQKPSSSISADAPDRDHTLGTPNGHYLYMEPSLTPVLDAHVARVKGPVMFGNQEGKCHVRLFYHVKGNHSGAINVYTEKRSGGFLDLKWSVNRGDGEMGGWKRVDIKLLEYSLFRLVIEGVRGPEYIGDVGIDDVTFTPHCIRASDRVLPPNVPSHNSSSCTTGEEFPCDGKCVPIDNKWCDFKPDCIDGSDEASCPSLCDFESGMCGWESESDMTGLPVTWERKMASQVDINVDHNPASASGHLLSSTVKNDRMYRYELSLVSPHFRLSSKTCSFSFWKLEKTPRPKLELKLRTSSGEGVIWVEKDVKSSRTGTWQQVTVGLPPCQKDFQLILFFKAFSSNSLPLSLDDLAFHDCALDTKTGASCQNGEFRCSNGLCIPDTSVCDLANDCCDWSDESHVTCRGYDKMTFESGLGGWKHDARHDEWKRVKVRDIKTKLPTHDHTHPSYPGSYLHVDCRDTVPYVIQHQMPTPIGRCLVRFWYLFIEESHPTIRVLTRSVHGITKSLASFSSTTNGTWTRAEVEVDMKERYDLILEGSCNSHLSTINVDDVVFSPGCHVKILEATTATSPSTTSRTKMPSTTIHTDSCHGFQCASNSSCIPDEKVCDSSKDCPDASDESNCVGTSPKPSPDQNAENSVSGTDGNWRIPVAVVLAVLFVGITVAAVVVILHKTGRIGSLPFLKLREGLGTKPSHGQDPRHTEPVQYNVGNEVILQAAITQPAT